MLKYYKHSFILIVLVILSCSFFEYDDPSSQFGNAPPETYLTLVAQDTIWISSVVSEETGDTNFVYLSSVFDTTIFELDTTFFENDTVYDTTFYQQNWGTDLNGREAFYETVDLFDTSAFHTITTSRKDLNWWGEDSDGDVIGYLFRWDNETDWNFTKQESDTFFVPISSNLEVFGFEVAAMDNDSLVDPTPARAVFPVENSTPSISFTGESNPQLENMDGDTSFTFPTRTFIWDLDDPDGVESITDVFYAVDDTCAECWDALGVVSKLTLTDIEPGFHIFYLKIRDIAGAESSVIYFPDSANTKEPDYWKVIPVNGDILIVDDFYQDTPNNALQWFKSVFDTLGETGNYMVWELDKELPYSQVDVTANLNYFKKVFWYAAYTGPELYDKAGPSIETFVSDGNHFFISLADMKDTSFTWFPIDSLVTISDLYGFAPNRILHSQFDSTSTLDLRTPDETGIYLDNLIGFESKNTTSFRSLYRLELPPDDPNDPYNGIDVWEGTPNVCGVYQMQSFGAGKAVLLSLPVHNSYEPLLDGNGNFSEFIRYLIDVEFENN